MKTCIELSTFPLPNSINRQNTISWQSRRIIKSNEARLFDSQVEEYIYKNKQSLSKKAELIQKWISEGYYLEVNIDFYFKKDRVFTKKGTPKKIDHNNFIKKTLDAACKALNFDDSLIFIEHERKLTSGTDQEFVNLIFSPIQFVI